MYYYTFRQPYLDVYEVTKWEEYRSYPLETYEIIWRSGPVSANMCSCPARTPCKHLEMLREMIECECIQEHWLWYQDENGWQTAHDQMVNYVSPTV